MGVAVAAMKGNGHVTGHEGITLDCPVSCLGVWTVGDLLHLIAQAIGSA